MTMNRHELAMIHALTQAIEGLTKAIQPDSFHKRQVPALRRQSKVYDTIKEKLNFYTHSPQSVPTKQVIDDLEEVGQALISA